MEYYLAMKKELAMGTMIIPERLHTILKIVETKNRLVVAKDFGLWERERAVMVTQCSVSDSSNVSILAVM